jgi:hypothetical protein
MSDDIDAIVFLIPGYDPVEIEMPPGYSEREQAIYQAGVMEGSTTVLSTLTGQNVGARVHYGENGGLEEDVDPREA